MSKHIFFVDPGSVMCDGVVTSHGGNAMVKKRAEDYLWVEFPTGQKYPINYMQTSDCYEVELPCGVFGGPAIKDLRRELDQNFMDVRITK